jgi:ribosomal-protein-alanine N-acetyltransferase
MAESFDISGLNVRDFHPGDLEQLLNIDQLCFPRGIAYTKKDFQRLLEKKGSFTIVAEFNQQIVAFGITLTDTIEKQMHLVTLDVLPSLQGKRIGSLLMNHILNRACLDKLNRIDLEVAEDNPKAIRFYRGQGFQTVQRLKKYYANNRDALLMTRKPN